MAQKTAATFAEMKAAIEDAETTTVILTGDIVFSGGIKIPATKKQLLIDGGGHTVTDNNSSSYTDALYVPSGAGTTEVSVRNVIWNGRNYYGVVCVYDDAANANVTISFANVHYTGPQMIYNRYGTTILEDCDVSIEKNGASVAAQEFCEGNRLLLKGKVTVNCASASSAVIWFPFAGAAFTVDEHAFVTINAPNTYMFYTDGAAKPIFTFKEHSVTRFSVKNGLFYASGTGAHIASSCSVERNATLYAESSANNGVPLFKCAGNFSVKKGANLFLLLPAKGTSPLLYFSTAAEVSFDSPENVVLYANGGKAFSFAAGSASAPNVVNISARQVNYWTAAKTPFASAGGFDDTPASAFSKSNGKYLTIGQKLSSSAVLSVSSDLSAEDKGYPLTAANFDLTKAAVLSMGTLEIETDKITDLSTAVSGSTAANARVIYADSQQTCEGTASEKGIFSLPLQKKAVVGDVASIKSNKNFLISGVTATVFGSVSITDLPDIPFNAFAVPKSSAQVSRLSPDWALQLTDTRIGGGRWRLYIALKSPLQSADETIGNAVVFSGENGVYTLDSEPILAAEGTTDKAGVITVSWQKEKGVLLALDAEELYKKGNYSSTLEWNVDFE